ncbi:MAG: WecB/TagA/CpsF family glycosyltransferase [Chloroflexota bacterium]
MTSKILAIKLADIGDLILVTPAIKALRQQFPNAEIDLLTIPSTAEAYPQTLFDEIVTVEKSSTHSTASRWFQAIKTGLILRSRKYDSVILFHHLSLRSGALKHALMVSSVRAQKSIGLDNGRGWFLTHKVPDGGFGVKHESQYWLDLVSAAGVSQNITAADDVPQTLLAVSDEDHAQADEWIPSGELPVIAIHPGTGAYSRARRWELTKFVELGRALAYRAMIVVVGAPMDGGNELAEAIDGNVINLTDKTTLPQLAAVLSRCDLLIGADSGVLHVASTVNTPTVAIFGPSNHQAWQPLVQESNLRVIRAGSLCSPCIYTEFGLGSPAGCPERTCMRSIQVSRVLQEAENVLEGKYPEDVQERKIAKPPTPHLRVLGVPIHKVTYSELMDQIQSWIDNGQKAQLATANPEFIMEARKDSIFRLILERATLSVADGIGLMAAARWKGRPLPERITGSDGVPLIAEAAARQGWRIYLLGAAPGVAKKTAAELIQRYPDLEIAGTYAGSPSQDEEDDLVERINQSKADILFVAYGAPKQDKWIARNLHRLDVSMAMGVGGAFDFISGIILRAPQWMQRVGLEWLYRLMREPWRWRRMLVLPWFAVLVLFERRK